MMSKLKVFAMPDGWTDGQPPVDQTYTTDNIDQHVTHMDQKQLQSTYHANNIVLLTHSIDRLACQTNMTDCIDQYVFLMQIT